MKKVIRCAWANSSIEMQQYHDNEWGVPVHNDRVHFEFLTLEAAQAGLTWATILKRRKGYKKAFADFDPKKVASFNNSKVKELITTPEIIRNRLKIESTINNASCFLEIQKEFGSFDSYIWQFVNNKTINSSLKSINQIPSKSVLSIEISKDLKKRGFKFVGATIIYAYMQAVGLVNDHITQCHCHSKCRKLA
jgi:DNA-3-methyladenine glycosylase I